MKIGSGLVYFNLVAADGSFHCRKHLQNSEPANPAPVTTQQQPPLNTGTASQNWGNGVVNPSDITNLDARRWSGSTMSNDVGEEFRNAHVSHPICKLRTEHGGIWMLIKQTKMRAIN